jgi:hypothetical protein
MLAYTIFAGVSLRKALAGAKSCGCFGPAAVDPKLMTAIDLAIVVLLLLAGPRMSATDGRGTRGRLRSVGAIVMVALMLLSAAGVAFAVWPKRGLVADGHGRHDFGVIAFAYAARCEHTFVLRNTSARAVSITGSKSSCRCTVADVPMYQPIPPGGVVSITVRADWSGTSGPNYSTFTLLTDNFWTPEVPLTIGGDIQ